MTLTRGQVIRQRLAGIALLVIVGLLGFVVIGAFNETFTRYVPVTLEAPRSGLQMFPGNLVKMRGIDVGKVDEVRLSEDGRGTSIALNMFPETIDRIPANSRVDLFQLTAFGNKFVNLADPAGPPAAPLASGARITATDVSVEANSLFSTLQRVLDSVDPAEVNTTLGAISTALQGNGDRIGRTVTQASDYLAKINRDLPTVQRDLRQTAQVANLFADVAPDLLRTLDNVTRTGRTVIDKRDQLNLTLVRLTTLGNDANTLLTENGNELATTLRLLRPTTSLLRKYSPMFPCWIKGVDEAHRRLSPILGGPGSPPGAVTGTSVLPAVDPYRPKIDLPLVNTARTGPNCWGLPYIPIAPEGLSIPKADPTYPVDAPNSFTNFNENPLAFQLFGPEIFNQASRNPEAAGSTQGGN